MGKGSYRAWTTAVLLAGLGSAAAAPADLPYTVAERLEACAAAEDLEPQRAVALAESVLVEHGARRAERAGALGCRGWALARLGHRDAARRDSERLQRMLAEWPPSEARATLLRRAGAILHLIQDRVAAVELYTEAEAELSRIGDEAGRIPLLINLGVLQSELRENERALVSYQLALALMERLDDWRHEAPVRYNLGVMLSSLQRWVDALPHLERSLELISKTGIGGPPQALRTQMGIANALLQLGRLDEAKPIIDELRAQPLLAEHPSLLAQWHGLDAEFRLALGEPEAALELLGRVDRSMLTDLQLGEYLASQAAALEALGRHEEANAVLRQMLEHREALLLQQNLERLATLESRLRDHEQRLELERLQRGSELQAAALAQSRRLQWLTALAAATLVLGVLAVLAWQLRMNRRLDRVSRTDSLTELPNRRDMIQRLQAYCTKPEASGLAVLVDIDHFKQINDRLGHDAGDAALRDLAARLARYARAESGVAGRWGGEEFLLLLPGSVDAGTLGQRMDQLLAAAGSPVRPDRPLTVSAGYAPLPLPGAGGDWQPTVQLADAALFVAKRRGRNGWAGYTLIRAQPEWPADRLAAEPAEARKAGVLDFAASRSATENLRSLA